ncbi:MAG: hypothetical protein ACFCUR_12905 [Rhodomicrobiaceae bacterium]
MPFPRMTWIGLLITTLGWGFLLSYPLIVSFLPPSGAGQAHHDPARFIPLIGNNAVITGMAIAILGALDKGIRLLTKIAASGVQPRQPSRPSRPASNGQSAQINAPSSQVAHAEPMLMGNRAPNDVVTRGALNGRDYVLFRDGSVVVETLLGPRRFTSITDAQEFIGAN